MYIVDSTIHCQVAYTSYKVECSNIPTTHTRLKISNDLFTQCEDWQLIVALEQYAANKRTETRYLCHIAMRNERAD